MSGQDYPKSVMGSHDWRRHCVKTGEHQRGALQKKRLRVTVCFCRSVCN